MHKNPSLLPACQKITRVQHCGISLLLHPQELGAVRSPTDREENRLNFLADVTKENSGNSCSQKFLPKLKLGPLHSSLGCLPEHFLFLLNTKPFSSFEALHPSFTPAASTNRLSHIFSSTKTAPVLGEFQSQLLRLVHFPPT